MMSSQRLTIGIAITGVVAYFIYDLGLRTTVLFGAWLGSVYFNGMLALDPLAIFKRPGFASIYVALGAVMANAVVLIFLDGFMLYLSWLFVGAVLGSVWIGRWFSRG